MLGNNKPNALFYIKKLWLRWQTVFQNLYQTIIISFPQSVYCVIQTTFRKQKWHKAINKHACKLKNTALGTPV